MVRYETVLQKFGAMGEKTGWTYFVIPADMAEKINPGVRTSYRVKGKIDQFAFSGVAVLPMGEGEFIIPFNATMRKATDKSKGHKISVQLSLDKEPFAFDPDLMVCLEDEPKALAFFKTLPGSHQKYFSKWVSSAKTDVTKTKRITKAVKALARKMGYAEMIREGK